jgi:hypothetical protein
MVLDKGALGIIFSIRYLLLVIKMCLIMNIPLQTFP